MNVPIYIGVTALILYLGEVVVLDFGQGLWFVNSMEKSLITPNQYQNLGIQICNDLTNPYRKLVIDASEELFIQLKMEG